MNDIAALLLAALLGAAAGALYFAGLWYTARRALRARFSVLVMIGSFLGRTALAFLVFAGAMRYAGVAGLLVALAAFLAARWAIVRRIAPPAAKRAGEAA